MGSRRRFLRDTAILVGAASLPRVVSAQDRSTEFDYVVVGAGAAGCVLANRLSADRDARVLLIEAGGPDTNPLIQVPGKWTTLLGTDVDWQYSTEPEAGLDGRRLSWPRGKTYGGSTALNAMAYVRGHQRCFDGWAREAGLSWGFQNVLPIFRRLEDNSRGPSDYRGAGGPLAVSDSTDPHAGHVAFLEGAREVGFEASPTWDFSGARQENGAGFYQKTVRAGRRHSAAAAFLVPALGRPNLVVWPQSLALRVTFTGTRATGLEISRAGGAVERIRVRREIVLSAGVIESPKLLWLSGVGPAGALRALGIACVADVPGVGGNLHDHPKVSLRWSVAKPLPPSSVSAGLLTFSGRAPSAGVGAPDIQFYVGRGVDVVDPFITLTVALSQPQSRGAITLRSADPRTPPVIHPNYFADPGDLDALLDGVRLARSIAEARSYRGLIGAPVDPGPGVQSADDLRAFIRRTADTIFHPAGTCRMGKGPDAVVDGQLRVRGVEGLRVADASVMPAVVNCQTQAACLLIAERAAEFVARG